MLAFGVVPFMGAFAEVVLTLVFWILRMLIGEVGAAEAFAFKGILFVGMFADGVEAAGTFAFEVVAFTGVFIAAAEICAFVAAALWNGGDFEAFFL